MTSESRKWMRFRIVTLLVFFLVLFIALTSRAFQLQILSGKDLKALAQKQHTQTLTLQPERGVIFDRNGEKLAEAPGRSKKAAEQHAAKLALEKLR